MQIKEFFKSTFKVAISIFLAVIALFVVGFIGFKAYDSLERQEAKQYEAIKVWPVDLTDNLQMTLLARTKLVDGRLLAEINFAGYPSYLSDPRLEAKNRSAGISLLFQDNDGFKVHRKTIQMSEFSSIIDSQGRKSGLRYEFDEYMGTETYARFSQLRVEWTLDTVLPNLAPSLDSQVAVTDHCAPNLTKAERLKRLAQHGTVRQTGDGSYSVGYRSLDFLYDGTMLNCQ